MSKGLFTTLLVSAALLACLGSGPAGAEEPGLRPAVASTLREVQELIAQKKYAQAVPLISRIDSLGDLNPVEATYVERNRAVALLNSGDLRGATKSLETLLKAGRLGEDEKGSTAELLVSTQIRGKDYPAAIDTAEFWLKNGVQRERLKFLRVQAYYLAERFAQAAQFGRAMADEAVASRQVPGLDLLKIEASCYLRLKDAEGYTRVLRRLVTYHPSPAYWQDLLERMRGKPGFTPSLQLMSYRLQLAADAVQDADDFLEMATLASRLGYPAEAASVLDQAVKAGVFAGDKSRYQPLRAAVDKALAEDIRLLPRAGETPVVKNGKSALSNGFNLVLNGRGADGIGLMKRGLELKDVRQPEEARMLLAYALYLGGDKIGARETLKGLSGEGPAAMLAQLWSSLLETQIAKR